MLFFFMNDIICFYYIYAEAVRLSIDAEESALLCLKNGFLLRTRCGCCNYAPCFNKALKAP